MLNRRHLRIKAFQTLYAYQQAETKELKDSEKKLLASVQKVHEFYIYLLLLISELASFEQTDIKEKGSKFLPTEADKKATTVLLHNQFIQLVNSSGSFNDLVKKYKLGWNNELVLLRELYNKIKSGEEYIEYSAKKTHSIAEDREFILSLYKKTIFSFPLLEQHLEEKNINWPVDEEVVNGMIIKTIKAFKEGQEDKLDLLPITANWSDDREFLLSLFQKTVLNDTKFSELIAAKTKNWDVERIAMVDTILMKMAVTELLSFSSIPVKVTMNEYIDISKEFSTPKSKVFINGILDKILIDLKNEHAIQKTGRGLME